MSAMPPSDIDLLSNLDRIVDLYAKAANGAIDLQMSEQELYCSESPRSASFSMGLMES
jgi:hypothetical protein